MPAARPLRAVICDPDPVGRAASAHAAAAAGFEILERTDNGPHLFSLVELLQPTLIVVSNELSGMLGYQVVEQLRDGRDDEPEVILVTSDPGVRPRALAAGAQGVLNRGDLEAMERTLAEVRIYLETGERRTNEDRRSGKDRRVHQDWSKVTSERRSGKDRRSSQRRQEEPTDSAGQLG